MEKENIPIHIMWHIDALMHVYPVTIVTTVNKEGTVNAAPYSLVLPFCSSPKNPQIMLIVNNAWNTAKNILETKEFVLNYPKADQLNDIVETSRFFDEGENELLHTQYTTSSARHVKPPIINECYQHLECRLSQVIKPSNLQTNFIGDILELSMDKGVYDMPRLERAKHVNPPAYIGVDEEMRHVFGKIVDITPVPVDLKVD